MKQKLTQEQKLTWKLTQQLGQAIELLQYNGQQLHQFLQEQVKENPFLEVETNVHSSYYPPQSGAGDFDESYYTNEEQNIRIYLKDQLINKDLPKGLKGIVEFGIDSLDDNGYLTLTLSEWAEAVQQEEGDVEQALHIIQGLDPIGVGARSLQECLLLQLSASSNPNEVAIDLITHHIEWVADFRKEAIKKKYQLSSIEIEQVLQEIQSCNPRPGLLMTSSKSDYVIPDGEVLLEQGLWRVYLSKWNSPKISVNEHYLQVEGMEEKDKQFVSSYIKSGNWLKQAVNQRYETMGKVFSTIVKNQVLFFEKGPEIVQPLTLKEIAQEVNLHVSTVSRAIKGKYIQTPHGVYPVKFFLQQGISTKSGGTVSSHSIKVIMKELVGQESKAKPLSDQIIAEQLKQDYDIHISRRTVAKYRMELFIPSSAQRKRRYQS
ncbi:RNA polymerase sigma-54 factor [Salirhabdus euzebyi]|uniref:RNA polymerase sigma-54 factor n=1 Tax=Salirhabdus euzebyi TaxID=394506 RepID=A0A841Q5B2_9BACI|nr:RNA polymerase factor sigma-54 [Salirhabdus euzebyi]MBB6453574.1 RNA polymerase sigma-54 factor [Salirhabdus euzebyi]